MSKLDEYIPEAHHDMVRVWQGYFPEKSTTMQTDYNFDSDIDDVLFEFEYICVRCDPVYYRDGTECHDEYWVNKPECVTLKVTYYKKDGSSWHFFKFDGMGRKCHDVWSALKSVEKEVLENGM